MSSFIYYDRGVNALRGDPRSLNQHYNYLRAVWKDGSPMVYGGNGHPSDTNASSSVTSYMFPSDPRDSLGWNEVTAGNPPFDRRGLGSTGPFNLTAGESIELALAIVTTQDTTKSRLDVFDTFKNDVNFVQNYYDNNIHYCQNWATGEKENNLDVSISIYPNPARSMLNIDFKLNKDLQLRMYNLLGKEVLNQRISGNKGHQLDVSKLERGFYLLQLNDGRQVVSRKILLD